MHRVGERADRWMSALEPRCLNGCFGLSRVLVCLCPWAAATRRYPSCWRISLPTTGAGAVAVSRETSRDHGAQIRSRWARAPIETRKLLIMIRALGHSMRPIFHSSCIEAAKDIHRPAQSYAHSYPQRYPLRERTGPSSSPLVGGNAISAKRSDAQPVIWNQS